MAGRTKKRITQSDIARELGVSPMEVLKSTAGSNLLIAETKEVAE